MGNNSYTKPNYQGNFHEGNTGLGINNSDYSLTGKNSLNAKGYNFQGGGSTSNSQRQKSIYNLQCEVCKMKGHTKETCYRVVGYPPDHPKFRKKYGGTRIANAVDYDDTFNPFSTAIRRQDVQDMQRMEQPVFTKDQYGQMLNKEKGTDDTTINMAGTTSMTGVAHANLVDNKDEYICKQWIVDSGASKHVILELGALFDTHIPPKGKERWANHHNFSY